MAQVADNGGPNGQLGLGKCVERFLGQNHKTKYLDYLVANHNIKPSKLGENLHLLPPEMAEEYNLSDTVVTLKLFYHLQSMFADLNYDYTYDHGLYASLCRLISKSRGLGVEVDRKLAKNNIISLENSIKDLQDKFTTMFQKEILEIEEENKVAYLAGYKSEKGREKATLRIQLEPELVAFNLQSGPHKKRLFMDKLGLFPKYLTKSGQPSFSKTFLSQWGEGGMLLFTKGTLTITLDQLKKVYKRSKDDSKWHIDLMAAGTTTGRCKGAGGLNVQAMARREPLLMSCIKARPGYKFVSADLSAGEPTIITEFSGDFYYSAATFDQVGLIPRYDEKGVLLIDDIYLMGMSVSPIGKDKLREVFHSDFDGKTFAEQWMIDPEVVKKRLKTERAIHKILMLGIGYSMGPNKIVESAFKAGYIISLKDAQAFFREYWKLFSDVKRLGKKLQNDFKFHAELRNVFGYRLIPDKDYKALNYVIQSTVSGLIMLLCKEFFESCTYAKFVTVIHDEIIFEVEEDKLEESKTKFYKAVEEVNRILGWKTQVRCGFVDGSNFYEAK